MKSYAFLLSSAILLTTACGPSLHYVHTGPTLPALADHAPVQVFLSGAPTSPYRELGMIEVEGSTLERRLEAAKDQARTRGGNGIVLLSDDVKHRTQTTHETVTIKDRDGKVKEERKVPRTNVHSYRAQTFAVISLDPTA